MSCHNPIDYSKTQRIVLLIDLNPLLHLQNPKNYLTSLLTSAKTLLQFPPLSLALSSFKLFFSSLSPLLSSSAILKLSPSSYNPNSLSFTHPHETLISLSQTLNFILTNMANCGIQGSIPKGSLTSSSMAQVIHDYAWDLCDSENLGFVRSNLVVLFSPVARSFKDLCDFVDAIGGDVLGNDCDDVFCDKFRGFFGYVRDAFVSRDIHFSWVDVRYEMLISEKQHEKLDECDKVLGLFQSGVKGLGWGFCSSDLIVFGSALVSFGLIYPMIGVSPSYCKYNDMCKKILGHLNLEILDVSGEPLECKYCDLQLLDLSTLSANRLNGTHSFEYGKSGVGICHQPGGIWDRFSNGSAKINVKALCRHSELMNIEADISDVLLVHEPLTDVKKSKEKSSTEFFADRVLDLLSKEASKSMKKKSPPLWQILLSFLYRRGYWVLVSLSNDNGSLALGILKPFTIHSAFLCILKSSVDTVCGTQSGSSKLNLCQFSPEVGDKIDVCDTGMDSVSGILGGDSRRKHKKHPYKYKDLSWSSFCNAAFEHCEMELEEAYFSKGCDTSKKLKFLKCWMKQVGKNIASLTNTPKVHLQDRDKIEERLSQSHQEGEQPLPPLAGENAVKEPSQMEETTDSLPEAAEAYFGSLSKRIQHGIESGVDLMAFAHRVVCSCIYWLTKKLGSDTNKESLVSPQRSDGSSCGGIVAVELIKILLTDPKDVRGKQNDSDLSSKACDKQPSKVSSEERVREYELQILFRMEILQSEIAVGIRDSTKHKFVKQICSLLESIQCNMDDGFFGDFSLNDYVGRTIRSRYSQNLGGVVHKIYEQMDLLLFDDEDESPNPLLNSEDSNQSWKIGDNDRGSEPNSTDDSISGSLRDNERIQKETGEADHDRKLAQAQERRERALRFASFTRRAMPELQRVWAPKPPKLSRSKSDTTRRAKRKDRRKESYDMVCETPMSGTKRCLFPSEGVDDQERGGCSTSSVHKVLFQDEPLDDHDWGL